MKRKYLAVALGLALTFTSMNVAFAATDGIAYKQIKEIAQMWGLKQPHKTIYTGFV